MPAEARRRSLVPSGWTPRGLIRHLTLDVERVWFRAVMAGELVGLPKGYDGWTAPEHQSDEELLEQRVLDGRYTPDQVAATRALGDEIGAMLERGELWWDESWASFEPDPAWRAPSFPDGWESAIVPPAPTPAEYRRVGD